MDAIFEWIAQNPITSIIIFLVILIILIYNSLNATKKRVEKSFSTIDVYLEKRFDEISALIEQTLAYMDHEDQSYSNVSSLRNVIQSARNGSINDKVGAVNTFVATPGIHTEAYPQLEAIKMSLLTANETVRVEDDIAAARIQYNRNATNYNTKITTFPTMLVAGLFGFKVPFVLFKVSEEKKERPKFASVRSGYNTVPSTAVPLSNPNAPVQPVAPVAPVQPVVEPVQAAPVAPVQTASVEPVQPVVEPVQAAPVEPVQPVVEPVQAAPVEPVQAAVEQAPVDNTENKTE